MACSRHRTAAGYAYHLLPPTPQIAYSQGDIVYVWLKSGRDTGRAVVTATPDAISSGRFAGSGRYRVQFLCDASLTCHVRPARMSPVFGTPGSVSTSGASGSSASSSSSGVDTGTGAGSSGVAVESPAGAVALVCAGTDEYRRLARSQVCHTDVVLELGCSYGVCTSVLAQHAGRVVGVDNSHQVVAKARRRCPGVRFEVVDVMQERDQLVALASGCNVVFADIGGDRQLAALVSLLPWLERVLAPRLIVVKNEELAASAQAWMQQAAGQVQQQQVQAQQAGQVQQQQVQAQQAGQVQPQKAQAAQGLAVRAVQQVGEQEQGEETEEQGEETEEQGEEAEEQGEEAEEQQPQAGKQEAVRHQHQEEGAGEGMQRPPQQQQQAQAQQRQQRGQQGQHHEQQPEQQPQQQPEQQPEEQLEQQEPGWAAAARQPSASHCPCPDGPPHEAGASGAVHAAAAGAVAAGRAGLVPLAAAWWSGLQQDCQLALQAGPGTLPLQPQQRPAEAWFLAAKRAGFRRHAMQYPLRQTHVGVRICRPFNYDVCYKAGECPFDHEHCHHCGERGHRAVECPLGADE